MNTYASFDMLDDGPRDASLVVLLAHGSGAPMDSAFMNDMARLLGERGVRVLRFEFAYMAARRQGAPSRPPPRVENLLGEYRAAVAQAAAELSRGAALFIGGKSLGGRVASMIVADLVGEEAVTGLVCLGYPFHPVGKPDKLRTAHLETLVAPALICQGERDPFGTAEEVAGYRLSNAISIHWSPDGDHGLSPRKASGCTLDGNLRSAADAIAEFAAAVVEGVGK